MSNGLDSLRNTRAPKNSIQGPGILSERHLKSAGSKVNCQRCQKTIGLNWGAQGEWVIKV